MKKDIYIYNILKWQFPKKKKKKKWPNEVFTRIQEEMDLWNTANKNEKNKNSQAVQW